MLISYIQSIMMIILEVICCKIFFESFAEKRSKNNYRNYSIILGIVVCEYVIASLNIGYSCCCGVYVLLF